MVDIDIISVCGNAMCLSQLLLMVKSHMTLPPHGSAVCGLYMGFLQIVRLCGLRKQCSQMLRGPHGNRKSHEIKFREETARRQLTNREAPSRWPQGNRKVPAPLLRLPYDFLGTPDRVKTVSVTLRWPWGDLEVTLRWPWGPLTAITRSPHGHLSDLVILPAVGLRHTVLQFPKISLMLSLKKS